MICQSFVLRVVFGLFIGFVVVVATSCDCGGKPNFQPILPSVEEEYELKQVYNAMQHPEIQGYFGSGDIYLFTHLATSNQFFIVAVGNGVAMFPTTYPIRK